jgi:hypothetical protein
MTQALYAHMNNKTIIKKRIEQYVDAQIPHKKMVQYLNITCTYPLIYFKLYLDYL